jgi:PD-(D/E)XK nuclease superfamily
MPDPIQMPAWSYSALTAFEDCPRRYYETKVTKRHKEGYNPQRTHGLDFHHAAEETLKHGTSMPDALKHYAPVVATIQTAAGRPGATLEVERRMALDASLRPVQYFDRSVWVRAVTDFSVTSPSGKSVLAGDWKTGKERPASAQLMLTAAVLFATEPDVGKVTTTFIWLQTGNVSKETFRRPDVPTIWNTFNPRVTRMRQAFEAQEFPPRPSGLCRNHCPVTSCPMNGHYVAA